MLTPPLFLSLPLQRPSLNTLVPTQFKATQLVVAIAVWAIPVGLTLKLLDFNLSILLLNDASEQRCIAIG
jgi:hypothetical protein